MRIQGYLTRRAAGSGKLRTVAEQRRSADARFQTAIPRGAVAIADDAVLRTEGRLRQKVEQRRQIIQFKFHIEILQG